MISEKYMEYIASLKEKCQLGDIFAMEELASFYYEEHPEQLNDATLPLVLECYETAARSGHQKASLNLGAIYCDGQYTGADYEKAMVYLRLALQGESARIAAMAACKLGDCYRCGSGVEMDYSKAFDYYLDGVLLCDYPVALYKLGDMYQLGLFVHQDSEKAYFIYCRAKEFSQRFANAGYGEILLRLADAKLNGIGTEQNVAEANKYLAMAKRLSKQK